MVVLVVVMIAAFAIPLVFCRETMYIFQVKTMLLQYSGLCLLVLMAAHQGFVKGAPDIFQKWAVRVILLFLAWEVFKSWNTIAPGACFCPSIPLPGSYCSGFYAFYRQKARWH